MSQQIFNDAFEVFETLVKKADSEGMPKRQLAIKSGLYPQQLNGVMRDKTIKFETVKKIAASLGYELKIILNKI